MTQERLQRFWQRVNKSTGCWVWTGSTNKGYGVFGTAGERRAHRLSWKIHYGAIPDGVNVLHGPCDDKLCVRPDHLYLGTQADNIRDTLERGQFPSGSRNGMRRYPERCHLAKLTIPEVKEIRRLGQTHLQRELAHVFSISQQAISDILQRKIWVHI